MARELLSFAAPTAVRRIRRAAPSGGRWAACICLCLVALAGTTCAAAEEALIDFTDEQDVGRIALSAPDEVSFVAAPDAEGLVVTCVPSKGDYPGITLKPEDAVWDLAEFGFVEARVTNRSASRIALCLRVDDEGDWTLNPWSAETLYLGPGEAETVRVYFGISWGKPGYALDPARVAQILLFVGKQDVEQSFLVESLVAGGSPGDGPPVNPEDVRTKPEQGYLLGEGVSIDLGTQIDATNARAELVAAGGGEALRLAMSAGADEAFARLKPAVGRWDLRDALQVVVRARNVGADPVTLRARLESAPGVCEWVSAPEAMAPGAAQEVALPFAAGIITLSISGGSSGGSAFESDRASGVVIAADGEGERTIEVESVRTGLPPTPGLPEWLGERPPVPGDWEQTMAEEFESDTIDESLWSIYHPNYWDKQSHFSKDNVILGDGLVRLRFEKKRGPADDDPSKPETDWATGFLTGTHKWTQRYGYFECRLKLPSAPGMWPAFWMMPDRGPEAGDRREDTRDGGMEIDILEYLARYGPYRYNVAAHWDGYNEDHRSNGSERLYVQPDAEGFYTAGLLWAPGRLDFYCNGAPIAQWADPRIASVPAYMLFTMVSGGWGGNELTGKGLPDDLVLDYVRAWQRSDWAAAP